MNPIKMLCDFGSMLLGTLSEQHDEIVRLRLLVESQDGEIERFSATLEDEREHGNKQKGLVRQRDAEIVRLRAEVLGLENNIAGSKLEGKTDA